MLSRLTEITVVIFAAGTLSAGSYAGAPGHDETASTAENLQQISESAVATTTIDSVTTPANEVTITPINSFRIDYAARYAAFKADATLELRAAKTANEYVYEVTTTARGLARLIQSGTAVESSRFAITSAGLQPAQYTYEDGSRDEDKASSIAFDWSQLIGHSVHEGVAAELKLQPGLLDRLTADLQSILELRAGQTPTSQNIAYKNSIRQYDLKLLGEEDVTVPAGTFNALKFYRQRPGSRRATLIWFAADAGYLPVRIELLKNDKTTITMVATSLSPAAG